MWRSILSIFLGVLAGGLTVFLIELPGMILYSPPPGTDLSNPKVMEDFLAKLPVLALSGVAIAWTIGPFVASLVACLIARKNLMLHGMIVGIVFLVLDAINLVTIRHPTWLAAVGIIAPPISACLGAIFAARLITPRPSVPQPYDMREKNMAC